MILWKSLHRYRTSRVTILVSTLFTEGGDWRSVYFFAKQMEARGEAIELVHVGGRRGFRQMLAAGMFSPHLLVNGLDTLGRWYILMICLLRQDVRIYLHETGYIFDQFRGQSPLRYCIVARILGRNPVLCVSKQAQIYYYKRFRSSRTHVVYECPGNIKPPEFDSRKTHIIMVGSINERKGVELFSNVADKAAETHPAWQFHWIGSQNSMNKLYLSSKVTWHGWQWNPRDLVCQCDLFLLSSVDDPCPLAALEALHMRKRCVAYKNTGIAELIEDIPGCEVFDQYEVSAVLNSLSRALSDRSLLEDSSQQAGLVKTLPYDFLEQMTKVV